MAKNKLLLVTVFFAVTLAVLTACAVKSSVPPPAVSVQVPKTPYAESDYPPEPVSGKTVFEFFRDEKIAAGWNLGNTLDSHNNGISGETVWGNPPANQELMNGIKAAGFDIIRIPVTWMGEIGNAPDYRLRLNRLKRVSEVAGMAHNAGLKVIINLHHDGSTESGGRDLGWLSISKASRSQNEYDAITAQFTRVWEQIAIYFKNYGDWLIFESFNELHDGSWQSTSDTRLLSTLNKWNQVFLNTVRSSGGNNESRYLMVGAYCNDNRQALSDNFSLPADTVSGRLILSFHYYAPYEFTIRGSRSSWGTDAEKQKVESDFAPFKEKYLDKNIPVIIGECGAVLQLYPNDSAKEDQARKSRLDYISHIFSAAKKHGLIPVYWDNGSTRGGGEKFGLFDRRTGQPNSPDSEALIKLMVNNVL
ncbi:MAG: glycoside hydrolase family 5 protein [Treponema sp.]|jgi:endoglucanase|nr:glycoside hydrolase family 5 protein [Treponema sp.]